MIMATQTRFSLTQKKIIQTSRGSKSERNRPSSGRLHYKNLQFTYFTFVLVRVFPTVFDPFLLSQRTYARWTVNPVRSLLSAARFPQFRKTRVAGMALVPSTRSAASLGPDEYAPE